MRVIFPPRKIFASLSKSMIHTGPINQYIWPGLSGFNPQWNFLVLQY